MKIGKRMFPGKRKRRVLAEILTFHNVCPDAHHFYAEIYEDDNPQWTGLSWISSSDDKKCLGKHFSREVFHDYKSAKQYCDNIFKKYFSKKTHKLVIRVSE